MSRQILVLAALVGSTLAGLSPPAGASTLFGLVDTGEIYVSTTHGDSWTVRATLPVHDAVGLRAGLSSSRLTLLSRGGGVWASADAGLSWTAVGAVPASDCVDLVHRSDGRLLVLTATGTVWAASNDGDSFEVISVLTASNCVSLACRTDGRLFVVTRTGEVGRSSDLGISWTTVATLPVPDAVACRSSGTALYLLTATGSAWRSLDDGESWNVVGVTNQVGACALTVDDGVLTAATQEGHIYRSDDGVGWAAVGSINQLTLTALADDQPAPSAAPEAPRPVSLVMNAPWPNPCPMRNGPVRFSFTLNRDEVIRLEVFDLTGRQVAARPPELFSGDGRQLHQIRWDPGALPAGLYLARLIGAHGAARSVKVTLLQ